MIHWGGDVTLYGGIPSAKRGFLDMMKKQQILCNIQRLSVRANKIYFLNWERGGNTLQVQREYHLQIERCWGILWRNKKYCATSKKLCPLGGSAIQLPPSIKYVTFSFMMMDHLPQHVLT